MSVNHSRMKRMSRSRTRECTSCALSGVVAVPMGRGTLPSVSARLMLSRVRRVLVPAVVAVLACAGGAAAARSVRLPPSGARVCNPAGAHPVTSDRAIRAYVLNGRVVACVRASGRRFVLGGHNCLTADHTSVGPLALSGSLVAYGERFCGIDTSDSTVQLLDA